jgi:hypothetical protein
MCERDCEPKATRARGEDRERVSRESATSRIDALIEMAERRLNGLRTLKKVAALTETDPAFEELLFEMTERMRSR